MELTIKHVNRIMLLLLIRILSIFMIQPALISNSNMENNSANNSSNNQFTGIFLNHHSVRTFSGNITPDCPSVPCDGGWI